MMNNQMFGPPLSESKSKLTGCAVRLTEWEDVFPIRELIQRHALDCEIDGEEINERLFLYDGLFVVGGAGSFKLKVANIASDQNFWIFFLEKGVTTLISHHNIWCQGALTDERLHKIPDVMPFYTLHQLKFFLGIE